MEHGIEQEGVAGRPKEGSILVQFDDQRDCAIWRDIQLVPRSAVQYDAQIRTGRREGERPHAAVGHYRAMRHAGAAVVGFKNGLDGVRASELQANLAIDARRHNCIRKRRGGSVPAWLR